MNMALFKGSQTAPLSKTCLLVRYKVRDSKMGQDLCTFPGHLNLNVHHQDIFLYWKQALQIHHNHAWKLVRVIRHSEYR